jgi:hypothetical protein
MGPTTHGNAQGHCNQKNGDDESPGGSDRHQQMSHPVLIDGHQLARPGVCCTDPRERLPEGGPDYVTGVGHHIGTRATTARPLPPSRSRHDRRLRTAPGTGFPRGLSGVDQRTSRRPLKVAGTHPPSLLVLQHQGRLGSRARHHYSYGAATPFGWHLAIRSSRARRSPSSRSRAR